MNINFQLTIPGIILKTWIKTIGTHEFLAKWCKVR